MLHHYHRLPAAPWEPERAWDPERAPEQPSVAGAERPWAAEAAEAARTGPWPQHHQPWRLSCRPYTRPRRWRRRPWPHWPWRRPRPPARLGRERARRPASPPPASPLTSSTSSSCLPPCVMDG